MDEKLRAVWEKAIHIKNWRPGKNSRICSKHFEENCFLNNKTKKRTLCRDAIPTIFANYPTYLQAESSKIARKQILDRQRRLRGIRRSILPTLNQSSASTSYIAPDGSYIPSKSFTAPRNNNFSREKELMKIIARQSHISSQRLIKLKALRQTCRRIKRKVKLLENIIRELTSNTQINDETVPILINNGDKNMFS